jgi:hypothetical protein
MGSVAAQEPWRSPTTAVADVHQVHCLDSLPSSAPVATCAQLAASAALHPGTEQRIVEAPTRASGGAGKGALIGLGLGLGVGGWPHLSSAVSVKKVTRVARRGSSWVVLPWALVSAPSLGL